MNAVYICDAVRTPFGRYGGALAGLRADDLAAAPLRALMARNRSVDWERVDEVYMGCANQSGEDNRNVARMAGLLAGLPVEVPGQTVNRLCGSGLQAVASAAQAIRAEEGTFRLAHHERCASHTLGSAAHHEVGGARLDGMGTHSNRIET